MLSTKATAAYFAGRAPPTGQPCDWSMTAHFKRLEAIGRADMIRAYQRALEFGRDQSGAPMTEADRAWLAARRDALIWESGDPK